MTQLVSRRLLFRPLEPSDWEEWRDLKRQNVDWLRRWHPSPDASAADPVVDRGAFALRCQRVEELRTRDMSYMFGLFVDGRLVGEAGINFVQRGPFQNGFLSGWVDEDIAGTGLITESCARLMQYGFEELGLHRLEGATGTDNVPGNRVCQKLGMRFEGVSVGYFETDGRYMDHNRYAITSDEWATRREELLDQFVR